MIEKLPFEITQGEYEGKKFDIKSHTSPFDMQVKINEIVDLLNAIVVDVDGTKCVDGSKAPAENVPGPIKLYVCADGSVYDNEDVAKSHAASILSCLWTKDYIVRYTKTVNNRF